MAASSNEIIIAQTKKWITEVVVACGFCPFAAKEIKNNSIHYEVLMNATRESALHAIAYQLQQLDNNEKIETSLLIIPDSFESLRAYLDLIDLAENLLVKENYEGIYQIASFHPHYLFAGTKEDDAANYTNRSPYPMLHFLREKSVSKAIDNYPDIDKVPGRNIKFAHEKGISYMQDLLASCMNI
jgi:uncharacterized protein